MEKDVKIEASKETLEKLTPEVQARIIKAFQTGTVNSTQIISNTDSQQMEVDDAFVSSGYGDQIILPPYDPCKWAIVPDQSTRLKAAINLWSRNTVGLGWEIIPQNAQGERLDVSKLDASDLKKFNIEKEEALTFFSSCNEKMSATKVFELAKWDEEAEGTGYLELVRDNTFKLKRMYHVPGHTVRVLKNGNGFMQLRDLVAGMSYSAGSMMVTEGDTDVRYFKNFGDMTPINKDTGETVRRLGAKNRASELIQFILYTPRSRYYGAGRYFSAAPAIAGNRLSAERNVTFFRNDTVPRGILFVMGGQVSEQAVQQIEEMFSEKAQGTENAGRLLLIQARPYSTGMNENTKVEMKFQPLTVGVTEDASYLSYQESNNEEIREAFGLSEVFFSTKGVTRGTAEVSRSATETNQFEPDRIEKEHIINNTIMSDVHWSTGPMQIAKFRFKRPEIEDPVDEARINTMLTQSGALTVNELRKYRGLDPLPTDLPFGDMPMVWALAQLNAKTSLELAGLKSSSQGDAANSPSGSAKRSAQMEERLNKNLDILSNLEQEHKESLAKFLEEEREKILLEERKDINDDIKVEFKEITEKILGSLKKIRSK